MADTNTYDLFQKVEKWTTKEKFNALGNLTEIETGTEYNLTGAIDETDLASNLLTKINGKLTAPTTPTADSAVTMLADGTVGTKPLSEIGGKLYLHVTSTTQGTTSCKFITYNTIQNSYTDAIVQNLLSFAEYPCYFSTATNGSGLGIITYQSGANFIFKAVLINGDTTSVLNETYETLSFNDTAIEV